MSEIEKMYENAGAYDFRYDCDVSFKDGNFGCITNCSKGEIKDYCTDKKYFKKAKVINVRHLYSPFTAEKQIELIKLIANSKGYPDYEYFGNLFDDYIQFLEFDEALAGLVNSIWILLPEEEKQQIKEILK